MERISAAYDGGTNQDALHFKERTRLAMKKKRHFRGGILLIFALLVIIIGAFAVWNMKLTDITVSGSSYYTDDELLAYIFPEAKYYRTVMSFWNNRFGEEQDIPFVKSYELKITGLHSAEITVYEKTIIGYIPYMGNYLYFDTEGYIVETSTEKVEGLLFIDGINFDYFVLNNQLPVDDDSVFSDVLVLSRVISQEELDVERVYFDGDLNITLMMGDLKVYLGSATSVEEKIHTLTDILSQIEGESGTLYLDSYSTVNDTVEYIFKRDSVDSDEEDESESESSEESLEETVTETVVETDSGLIDASGQP